jgi:hypothetical protein
MVVILGEAAFLEGAPEFRGVLSEWLIWYFKEVIFDLEKT